MLTSIDVLREKQNGLYWDLLSSGKLVVLSNAIRDRLEETMGDLQYQQTENGQNEMGLYKILIRSRRLPQDLRLALQYFATSEESYLLIKNLPQNKCDEVLLGITSLLGFPFAHKNEGALIMHVKPNPSATHATRPSYQTWDKFQLHTELACIHYPPDYLALRCINNVPGAFTYVASGKEAIQLLSREEYGELQKPQFIVPAPPHFGPAKENSIKRALLQNGHVPFNLRVRFDGLVSETEQGSQAAKTLLSALDSVREAFVLEPNSLLIINNRTAAHGRSPFTPTFKVGDRELHRIYIAMDISKYGHYYDQETRRVDGF